jgi:hypothetical protein
MNPGRQDSARVWGSVATTTLLGVVTTERQYHARAVRPAIGPAAGGRRRAATGASERLDPDLRVPSHQLLGDDRAVAERLVVLQAEHGSRPL